MTDTPSSTALPAPRHVAVVTSIHPDFDARIWRQQFARQGGNPRNTDLTLARRLGWC